MSDSASQLAESLTPAGAEAPEQPDGQEPLASRVQPLDFSQPTKFTTELRRRIERMLAPFCKALALRMSAELRAPVELRQVDSAQLSWAAARSRLDPELLSVAVESKQANGQMMLGVELPLLLSAIECMLGGSAASAPEPRRLSDIDWALSRRLLDAIVLQLSLVWRDIGGAELTVGEVDLEGDPGLTVAIGEPTFSVELLCTIGGCSSTLSLLIPWGAVEPLAEEILGRWATPAEADPRESIAVRRGLAGAKVLLRAEIGTARMPVERVLAIEPGALISLRARAEHGVRLLAESVSLARGLPGRSGVRRAVKLTTGIEPQAQARVRPVLSARARTTPVARAKSSRAALSSLARLRGVEMRVWAELGRASMPLSSALKLPEGAVLELEQGAEDPVELFVNGLQFAAGSLVVTGDGEWAVQVGALC